MDLTPSRYNAGPYNIIVVALRLSTVRPETGATTSLFD